MLEWMGLNSYYYYGLEPKMSAGMIKLHECITTEMTFKVGIFWEGHKILQNLHLTFVYSTYKVSLRIKISQNFVAFSEYMNFTE